jgi:serine phosphatase RsbU (regulator of sigma subunit)
VAPLIVGAASRIYPGESVNGDAWFVDWHADVCRITVVDGLGHGPQAAEAAQAARRALESEPGLAPAEALRACHAALGGTRGAAIAIVTIDPRAHRLRFSGVGNVDGYLIQQVDVQRLVSYRGIVGAVLPDPRTFEFKLGDAWLVVLHTDGLRRLGTEVLLALHAAPQQCAEHLLATAARETDDATVVVVGPASDPE